MTPATLEKIGRSLFGERWKSPLARSLGMGYRAILRYYAGDTAIPRAVSLAAKYLATHPKLARRLGDRSGKDSHDSS